MKKNTYTTSDALYEQFQQVVQKHPQLVAIHLPDGAMTYHELHQSSDRIAHYLCRQEITSVGVSLAPCKAYFIMLVGAMKAGCLIYPMDPESPTQEPLISAYVKPEPWLQGRLILSPHNAFFSQEGIRELRQTALREAQLKLQGLPFTFPIRN